MGLSQMTCTYRWMTVGSQHDSARPFWCLWYNRPTILLRRLDNWFGVSGKALDWFKSYLTGRSQRIKLDNCLSSRCDLSFGVPQGSVLGPQLFTLYSTPLSSLISGHAIPHHLYADDSQLYVSFSSGNSSAELSGLQSCLASVQSWMSTNKLKLNPDKTKFLLIWEWTATEKISLCFQWSFWILNATQQNLLAIF